MIDPAKKYMYCDQQVTRIFCTDLKNEEWLIAIAYLDGEGREIASFTRESDLIEVKPVIEAWININPIGKEFGVGGCYIDRDAADGFARVGRIACIPISFREGDGLEPKPVAEPEWEFPSWLRANWIAMDECGEWYAYEEEPATNGTQVWAASGEYASMSFTNFSYPPCTDWRQSKRKNPRCV